MTLNSRNRSATSGEQKPRESAARAPLLQPPQQSVGDKAEPLADETGGAGKGPGVGEKVCGKEKGLRLAIHRKGSDRELGFFADGQGTGEVPGGAHEEYRPRSVLTAFSEAFQNLFTINNVFVGVSGSHFCNNCPFGNPHKR